MPNADPRSWSQKECSEYTMGLAAPCPERDAGWLNADYQGHLLSCVCGGTGKVYPLREACLPCRGKGNAGINPDSVEPCRVCGGSGHLPVAPHLETLRAAALQAGFTHECFADAPMVGPSKFGHRFLSLTSVAAAGRAVWLYGPDDLLTAHRALCLALMAMAASDAQ